MTLTNSESAWTVNVIVIIITTGQYTLPHSVSATASEWLRMEHKADAVEFGEYRAVPSATAKSTSRINSGLEENSDSEWEGEGILPGSSTTVPCPKCGYRAEVGSPLCLKKSFADSSSSSCTSPSLCSLFARGTALLLLCVALVGFVASIERMTGGEAGQKLVRSACSSLYNATATATVVSPSFPLTAASEAATPQASASESSTAKSPAFPDSPDLCRKPDSYPVPFPRVLLEWCTGPYPMSPYVPPKSPLTDLAIALLTVDKRRYSRDEFVMQTWLNPVRAPRAYFTCAINRPADIYQPCLPIPDTNDLYLSNINKTLLVTPHITTHHPRPFARLSLGNSLDGDCFQPVGAARVVLQAPRQ